ncbi:hypothetical protein ACH4PU_33450 [Streptomyces sp. NPDC021100]|uniref:hypothetical protein n=1 Tax=Streptomyces sp. NPDC021100 TaxID=3365114 RepID=UPI0037A7EC9D
MFLSDWSESDDEEEWERHVPLFAEIVSQWCRKGYIDVYEGPQPPAWMDGRRITGAELDRLLADPAAWRYREHSDSVFGLALGGERPGDRGAAGETGGARALTARHTRP